MKTLILSAALAFTQLVSANSPEGYPVVNGVVKNINVEKQKISIKHEEIPNLDMEAMTMSFLVKEKEMLSAVAVGDEVQFVADEVGGDLTLLWIQKL